jgi:phosphoenolpyruvate phosphomutase
MTRVRVAPSEATGLRALLEEPCATKCAGAYDALSAVIAETSGFDAIWASSFGISASRAVPDMSLLTMTDYLAATAHMVEATSIPVLADCDTGFGSCANVALMVSRYEAFGIAGVCIEDKVFPKMNSFVGDNQALVTEDEFARKIACACATRRADDFVIVARTEALVCGAGQAEALRRARRYVDAGADAIFIHSKQRSADEIMQFLSVWDGYAPIVLAPTTYSDLHIDDATSCGVSLIIYANHTLRAAVRAATLTLTEIADKGSSETVESEIASLADVFELERLDEWVALDA